MSKTGGPDPAVMAAIERGNKVVFFDIAMGEDPDKSSPLGRIKMELFYKDCPKTCENFRQFCTGEYSTSRTGAPVGYLNCTFHRVIKDFMIQGGDFVNQDGTGKTSIYNGTSFPDENFIHKHESAGMLSMANSGKDSNGSQFFITCAPCDWLDGKHVVFGKILDEASMLTARRCEAVPVLGGKGKPRIPLRISQCGEL
jgi:peptidyl-prolyl isomerase H (cyclophilin H)|eukprot:227081_1